MALQCCRNRSLRRIASVCRSQQALFSSHQQSESQQAPAPASEPSTSGDGTVQEIAGLPGYLKGPIGRRVVRALGEDEWAAATYPQTGQPCWRNIKTGELTVPGVPKPDTWQEVVDKHTGLLYYWNRRSGETTALGEPKPGPYGRQGHAQAAAQAAQPGGITPDSSIAAKHAPKELDTRDVFSLVGDKAAPASSSSSSAGAEQPDTSLLGLVKSPLGVMFVGLCGVSVLGLWLRS